MNSLLQGTRTLAGPSLDMERYSTSQQLLWSFNAGQERNRESKADQGGNRKRHS